MNLSPQTAALYPFESHALDLGGVRYHYLDEGHGDPIVMVHGNPTWSFYYRDLVKAFRDTHRVVVPDHVGCGMSDKPQVYPYTLAQHVANLERLVLALDLRDITLVVHDWGGAIGFGMAVRHPERIKRMVIFNTAAFHSDFLPLLLGIARVPVLGDLLIRGCNAFAGLATRLAIAHHERMTPAVRAGYLAPYDSWANRIATLRFVQDIPHAPSHPTYPTLQAIERDLPLLADRPVLMVWGMRDWVFTPAFLQTWMKIYPHAEVRRLHDAAHYVVEDAGERIVGWMDAFLERDVIVSR